ncbi:MAG: hypothetical protein PVH28_09015 [Desulfobacterales bacterium]
MLEAEITKLSVAAERTRTEAENAKKELATLRDREAELARQVDELKKRLTRGMAPVLVVSKPEDGTKLRMPTTMLQVVTVDDKGISDFQVRLNGQPLKSHDRPDGIRIGVQEMTRFGMGGMEMERIAELMKACIIDKKSVKEEVNRFRSEYQLVKYSYDEPRPIQLKVLEGKRLD